jgi:hypothetical protein
MIPDIHRASCRPSKQFLIRGGIAIGIVLIVFVVQTNWFRNFFRKTPVPIATTPVTVGDTLAKDSNSNSIADWEERLWGLDPAALYTNGIPNKTVIETKKKALGITDTTDENLNETDQLARQLFGLTAALGQSPDVDDSTLKEIATQIGQKVQVKTIHDQYSIKDITTIPTTIPNLTAYYKKMKTIITKQPPVADIDAIATALQNEDLSVLDNLTQSTTVYTQLATSLRSVPVPVGLVASHIQIMNSFSGIAQSFEYMQQLQDNSIVALVGVATYKTYSSRLTLAITDMSDYLKKYGILN